MTSIPSAPALRCRRLALAVKTAVVLACALGLTPAAHGQTVHEARSWFGVVLQGGRPNDSPWRWSFDVQDRNRNFAGTVDQAMIRPAIGYALTERSSVWMGYAYVPTDSPSGRIDENRAWQQYLWSGSWGAGSFSSRTRMEERFVPGGVAWRLRQQERYSRPLPASGLSLVLWDEVMGHANAAGGIPSGFDQNRAFAGIGIRLKDRGHLDAGYQNNFIRATGPDRMHHLLALTLGLTF
jgi:hypothetical protein